MHRRPASLSPLLQDLRTFSLFATGKVLLASDSAVFADRSAAGELIDDAADVVPLAADGHSLSARERQAASRLLQALHLFDINPYAGEPERALAELPAWVLEGGKARKAKRGKKQVEELRSSLAGLLDAARREEIQGTGEGDLTELSEVVRQGLPPGPCPGARRERGGDGPSARPPAGGARRRARRRPDRIGPRELAGAGAAGRRARAADRGRDRLRRPLRARPPHAAAGERQGGPVDGGRGRRLDGPFRRGVPQARQPRRGEGGRPDRPQAGRADGRGPRRGGRLAAPRRHRGRPRRRGARPSPPPDRRRPRTRWSRGSPSFRCSPRSAASSSPCAA